MQKPNGNKNQGIRNIIHQHQGTNGSRQSKQRDVLFCPTPLLKGNGAEELEYLTAPSGLDHSNDTGLKE